MLKLPTTLLDNAILFDSDNAVELIGASEGNSISSGQDDGSIDKLAGLFWKRQRHASLDEYSSNMNALRRDVFPAPAPGTAELRAQNLAGHGSSGYVEVGAGQQGWNDEYIATYNEDVWGWPMALAGNDRDGPLTIWSCSTGGSVRGALLLFRLAQITKRTVRARTGLLLLYTQGSRRWIEFERGSQWQMASPDMTAPPPPIKPPSAQVPALADWSAPVAGIVSARVTRLDPGATEIELAGAAATAVADALFASAPFSKAGDLPGRVTALIVLRSADGSELRGRVLADRVFEIVDVDARFFAGPELEELLGGLTAS